MLKHKIPKLNPTQIRFVHLFLGGESGDCFGNATLSYLKAYGIETVTTKVRNEVTGAEDYTPAYKAAKAHASRLVANGNIQRYSDSLLLESGYTPAAIKRGIAELAFQRKYPAIALAALEKMAKISGMFNDRNVINIPALEDLTIEMRRILSR